MVLDAVRSVQAQTFTDWELIVVDDGSKDNTREVIGEVADQRIRYIYQENKGLPGARNTGIRNARGEWIAFLDSDDAFLPGKLAAQLAVMQARPGLGLLAAGFIETDRELRPLREMRPWENQPTLTLLDWVRGCPICPGAPLVRKSWLEKAGLFDERMPFVEDWDLWLRMAYLGCPMDWLPVPVCYYRIHGGNMVRQAVLMKNGMLTLFDKLYSHEDLPAEVLALRDQAYANAYLNGAARAYAGKDPGEGCTSLSKALRFDPDLLQGRPPRALSSLISFALSPLCGDAPGFLNSMLDALPPEASGWTRRQAFGAFHAVRAFEAARYGHPDTIFRDAAAAVWQDPSWLANRGLIAIALRSLLGLKD
ncbi:glycosyltransferase [Longilinea arvoryzae]|uniref:Glycosyltransferase n=2 Tax=Longilinea arvoryzae TaxID=360412 RepID=A0A0S7BIK9_9CHLR|nr:glycosyltransferase [Longilinea arvoryzae]